MISRFTDFLEWEYFEGEYFVEHPGVFHNQVGRIHITRDSNLQLKLEAKGVLKNDHLVKIDLLSKFKEQLDLQPIKVGIGNCYGEIKGCFPMKYNIVTEANRSESTFTQTGNPKEFIYNFRKTKSCYLTEWLVNIETESLWPIRTSHDYHIKYSRKRYAPNSYDLEEVNLDIEPKHPGERNCIELSISIEPELKILFGVVNDKYADKKNYPGFITYHFNDREIPSAELREKIRTALSFALGRLIGYLGYTSYDISWKPIQISARNVYIPGNEQIFKYPSLPPTVIHNSIGINILNSERLSKIINGFIKNYDKYNLLQIMWLYWHAYVSIPYTKPAQFGAVIEALINKYLKSNEIKKELLSEDFWRPLKQELINSLKKFNNNLNDTEKDILSRQIEVINNKIHNLNQIPSGNLNDIFFELTKLKIGEIEKEAMRARNKSAHGGLYSIEESIPVTMKAKVLYVLCNRILLKLICDDDLYIDYYAKPDGSYSCIREISESISEK